MTTTDAPTSISVTNLGKRYVIAHRGKDGRGGSTHLTLRDVLVDGMHAVGRLFTGKKKDAEDVTKVGGARNSGLSRTLTSRFARVKRSASSATMGRASPRSSSC